MNPVFKKYASDNNKSLLSLYKIYKYFIFDNNTITTGALFLIIFIAGLTPVIDSIFLQKITDSIELYLTNNSFDKNISSILIKWVFIYIIWWESLNLLWRLYDYIYLKTLPQIKARVISEFYEYIQYHSHNFFQSNLAGDISGRVTEASRSIEMIFAYINEKIFKKFIILFTTIIAFYYVHSTIALIFIIWLTFFLSFSLSFSKKINEYSIKFSENKANISGKLVDSIANISLVRMFSSHKFERTHLNHSINGLVDSDCNLQWFMLKLRYILGLSCTIMIGSMIYYTISLRSDNLITTGQCVMIITLCVSVLDNIWDLTQEFGDLFEQIGAFNQSLSLLSGYDVVDQKNAKEILISNPDIVFKNVSFQYKQNDNNFINQSLTIPAYQKIGLAGFSGSGKTTFTRLISRIYDIFDGQILIDNQDIKNISLHSLNKNISIISQEPMLFHRTIRENINYANPNATEEEVITAAKSAHIHNHIMTLPDGYDTICGERGNNLSGGQRQRINIARAFLKQSPILIIDEATSALDAYTEKMIQESLTKLMKDKTVIIIAHRLSTLLNMDRILVFSNGHMVEDGTHEELINDGEIYKLLWKNY